MRTLNKSNLLVIKEYNSNKSINSRSVFTQVLLLQYHGYNIIIIIEMAI